MSRLTGLLRDVAAGRPPQADGRVEVVPQPGGRSAGVLGFTAHHVVAADVPPEWVRRRLDPDDLSAPLGVRFLTSLGERLGRDPGALDVVLVSGPGGGGPSDPPELRAVNDADHPRVRRARRYRTDVTVHRAGGGLVAVGRGFAGRWEVAVEVEPAARGRGLGRRLAAAARTLVPAGEPVWAQVSPGNVASLRAFTAAGYVPVGSEVLFPAPRAG